MTAVANPPSLSNLNRPQWGVNGGQSLNPEDPRGMFTTRKSIQRTNSSSSISSNSSTSSSSTLVSSNGSTNGAQVSAAGDLSGWPNANTRKRPPPKGSQWPAQKPDAQPDLGRMSVGRPQMMGGMNMNGVNNQPSAFLPSQGQMNAQGGMVRPMAEPLAAGQPVLYLLSLNGTFERKTISVPFLPDTLRIGRQTNAKTVPTPVNGFFDSKVLSRQHAEIWADRQGKIWIRDIKSSNGTFVNGTRLSAENRESEPHELQTSDHLELGIDIVSEDQKSVVHHKVAAKVEHAGFLNPSSNLLDMSFGDLDPTNPMMQQMGGQFRGRTASQASMGSSGRLGLGGGNMNAQANGMAMQRGGLFLTQPSTEAIVKKLHQEMRNARLQAEDLSRTNRFIHALLSKEDLKNEQKPEAPEPPKSHLVNGSALPFRPDPKMRFSEPPAPPPQQPLPEKPDVPSLKRGTTERPKAPSQTSSPVRPDNTSQILQLTEALNSARLEIDTQHARLRDLEEMYQKERQARESAEEQVRRLEDATSTPEMNGAAVKPEVPAADQKSLNVGPDLGAPADVEPTTREAPETAPEPTEDVQARIDAMVAEVKGLKDLVEEFKQRAEKAEAERDEDRKTLAEMVTEIRRRDEDDARRKAKERMRSSSAGRKGVVISSPPPSEVSAVDGTSDASLAEKESHPDPVEEHPTLSRANTITPSTQTKAMQPSSDPAFIHGMPYASMLGVVIFGMGLMAYLNGWQPQGRLDQ